MTIHTRASRLLLTLCATAGAALVLAACGGNQADRAEPAAAPLPAPMLAAAAPRARALALATDPATLAEIERRHEILRTIYVSTRSGILPLLQPADKPGQ